MARERARGFALGARADQPRPALPGELSRATVWLDRGVTRRIEQGFASFEEWRDQVLEEEEREQHKLGRKIVAEEHWMRYGVSARRKRNVRRVGLLAAVAQVSASIAARKAR